MKTIHLERMKPAGPESNPVEGTVRWKPSKSLWYAGHALIAASGMVFFFDLSAQLVGGALTVLTLCCGHTVGLHRLLIHRNFEAPLWLRRVLVYLGTLVGMGGPFGMIYLHDIRDWAQRHEKSHPFYTHGSSFWKDWWWNLHCRLELKHPPVFSIEPEVAKDPFYRFLQRTWMLQQLPLAAVLFLAGGWSWVAFGISQRIVLSLTGHWLIGFFAHNVGQRTWHLHGHSVQGYNLPHLGLLTMGECWHNNHHAYPDSARLGIERGQVDPGWWFVLLLKRFGWARDIRVPENLPKRPERQLILEI